MTYSEANTIAEQVKASVKWFRPDKGFGFLTLADTGEDAFVHSSAFAPSDLPALDKGVVVLCDVCRTRKGLQVAQVREVRPVAAEATSKRQRPSYALDDRPEDCDLREGIVKYFNPVRGFGFVARAEGGRDVFLHAKILNRSGLPIPKEGQRVHFAARQGPKGDEVSVIAFSHGSSR